MRCLKVSINKKIRNATKCQSDGIVFKSQLEKMAYNCLIQEGFKPHYEEITVTLVNPEICRTPFYDKETDSQLKKRRKQGDNSARKLVLKSGNIQGIKYTPDFYFKYGDLHVYIEMKGIENDVHYIKKKLFRLYLDNRKECFGDNSIYFEIYNKKQLLQAIEIIRRYEESLRENKRTIASFT